jgi:hypothetical protein
MDGHVRIRRTEGNSEVEELGGIHGGDWAAWKYIDFSKGARKISLKVKSNLGGTIEIRTGSPDGRILGKVTVPSGSDWTTLSAKIKKVKGVKALYLTFDGVRDPADSAPKDEPQRGGAPEWAAYAASLAAGNAPGGNPPAVQQGNPPQGGNFQRREPAPEPKDEYELFSIDSFTFSSK